MWLQFTKTSKFILWWSGTKHPAGQNHVVSQVLLQLFPGINSLLLALCKILNQPNPWCQIRQSTWPDSCLKVYGCCPSTTRLFLCHKSEVLVLISNKYSRIRMSRFCRLFQYVLLYGQVSDVYYIASLNLTKEYPSKASIDCGWRTLRSSPLHCYHEDRLWIFQPPAANQCVPEFWS